jgi:Zn-dependent M28 family amino/carboxypeptidase
LLCAHWDTRPWSDEEADYDNRHLPVPGANDGASGVGVLLEVARQLQVLRATDKAAQIPTVDIIFFDGEDMGTPNHYTGPQREDTWCLGSQLWAKLYMQTPIPQRTKYQYGILLDMVGDPSATFPREYFSVNYAGTYVELIWRTATKLGYGRYFVNQPAYPITDDHYYLNTLAGIPCVDIIDYKPNNGTGFAEWWHTQQDDMRNINHQTLQAVGETVITTICSK